MINVPEYLADLEGQMVNVHTYDEKTGRTDTLWSLDNPHRGLRKDPGWYRIGDWCFHLRDIVHVKPISRKPGDAVPDKASIRLAEGRKPDLMVRQSEIEKLLAIALLQTCDIDQVGKVTSKFLELRDNKNDVLDSFDRLDGRANEDRG